ncbi:anthranilate synthase component I [Fastidiosibacter lacustris]|uniref:anthranilate synthase component I n=1 Tax=Fastidiosibacter lacustris TaxID=2056695 RepID=UPI000E34AE43|nr:anthranilate synthase component I [Fastidiosibacter lacustris]
MNHQHFTTIHGISVHYNKKMLNFDNLDHITSALDNHKGMMLSSGIEYPGRYNRWELGFINPPVEIIAYQDEVKFKALNPRGEIILKILLPIFDAHTELSITTLSHSEFHLHIHFSKKIFSEEQRSQQPSVATPLSIINEEFRQLKDNMLGLFGAFAYDLIFAFESSKLNHMRDQNNKLYHLFFADHVYVIDKQKELSFELKLELSNNELNTQSQSTTSFNTLTSDKGKFKSLSTIETSLTDDEYVNLVKLAKEEMRKGNIFEIVYSRLFSAKVSGSAANLYQTLKTMNPSPYEFYCQLGDEQIIGTSPEMFVRCEGKEIESCPISGTIRRGNNAMEDELKIRELLNSYKDEVELTMCTDVDRNDKARICEADSIKLISRRTIERYVGLFHTVDHVKGKLRDGYNGLDAFLSHMWAVTLTGSPKKRAVELIEKNEVQTRNWYGGAIGCLGFNGDMNSTITIRTVHLKNNHAYYQSGATLVWDSKPQEEALETIIKATTFYKGLGQFNPTTKAKAWIPQCFDHVNAIMIDHEDSFVHTLASYFRKLGVKLETFRTGTISTQAIIDKKPDLIIYSPGPGTPSDFALPQMIQEITKASIPQFGVCLGLQGMFEAFGGKLKLLSNPMHGKTWKLKHKGKLFDNIDQGCVVAAYHSIIADPTSLPKTLKVTSTNEHGDIMSIEHNEKPAIAVQFHPESILTLHDDTGLKLVHNALLSLCQ